MSERIQGVVKWFNITKGYGFIKKENGDEIFVHKQEIVNNGYRSLKENDKVEFTEFKGPRGIQAYEVNAIK